MVIFKFGGDLKNIVTLIFVHNSVKTAITDATS